MAILVSGGAGYIGSHTCIELLNAGYDIVVADNYYNASPVVLDRVKQITGKDFRFYKADMTRREDVEKIFSECPDITAVIQFAAYKAVGESVSKPIEYYYNNLNCTLVILDVMRHHDCHNFVFSSSATVYGDPASVPITEDFPVGATTNPYGTTKAFTERILQDVCKADPSLNVALLRYFNPIGAHKSGLIGEDPNGIPNNLMPYIAKVAVGKLEKGMDGTKTVLEALAPGQQVAVFIGPEGGFDEEEIQLALKMGVKPVSLGKRILRTETAGPAILALLMMKLEGAF